MMSNCFLQIKKKTIMKQLIFTLAILITSLNLFSQYDRNMVIEKRSSITVGILQGGGSLVGADYETLVINNFGVQLGAGLIGFGGGINYHFKPSIRSSFISLQYMHQGIGDSYAQSVISSNYVFRGKKWFTFQIGFGFPIEYGSAMSKADYSPVILTYAIGAYFPL